MEDHVTLNYADTVEGSSELMFWVKLGDGSTLDTDVRSALLGSGTWLALPSSDSDDDKPTRLMIRRSLQSSDWRLRLASVRLDVLYARKVVVVVYDFQGQVAAQHTVS